MPTSSRTPEGEPLFCEVCGEVVVVEATAAGDALCPACGGLLRAFRHSLVEALHVAPGESDWERLDDEIDRDSIDDRFTLRQGVSDSASAP